MQLKRKAKVVQSPRIKKQISVFTDLEDWKVIRLAAAQEGVTMTELMRRWIGPDLERVREQQKCAGQQQQL